MSNRYYHGLAGGIPFFEEQEVLDESLRTLRLIFKLGGIHCRKTLHEYGIKIYNEKGSIYNGDDYISICIDNPTDEEFIGENFGLDSSFFLYANPKITIELKSTIEKECIFREEPYKRLPAERQIYKCIDVSNFKRILVGLEDLKDTAISELSKICKPYDITVMTFKEANNLEKHQKKLFKSNSNK